MCVVCAMTVLAITGHANAADKKDNGSRKQEEIRQRSRPKGPYSGLIRQIIEEEKKPVGELKVRQEKEDAEAAARAEIIESDEMLEALVRLDRYFAVQVEYDERQIEKFYAKLNKMSSTELRLFLLKFKRERAVIQKRHVAFERLRKQIQARKRDSLRRQRGPRGVAAHRSYHGYFGNHHGYFTDKQRVTPTVGRVIDYGPRPPLVTSLEVARYAVFRSILGSRW